MSTLPSSLRFQIAHADGPAVAVAERFGVHLASVLRHRKKHGVFRRRGRNIPTEIKERAIELRRTGLTLKQVAAKSGWGYATIWKWCRGVPKPPRAMTPEKAEAMKVAIQLRRDGALLSEIQKAVGYTIPAIWNWCEDARVNPQAKPKKK